MNDRPRILLAFEKLPEYLTPQERISHAAHDVREAMQKVDRRLRDKARELGMDVDEAYADDTDNRFGVAGGRTVIARLRVVPRE